MRVHKLVATTSVAGALLIAGSALANPRTHDGFYLQPAIGLGYMSTSASTAFGDESISGISTPLQFMIGGSPIEGLVIGGGFIWDNCLSPTYEQEQTGATLELDDVSMYFIGLGPFASFYPDPMGGLHFDLFIGWGGLELCAEGNCGGSDPTGLLLSLAAGYEFWVSDEWSIGPAFRFGYGMFAYEDVDFPTISPALLATFTYH